jgi:MFS family permease
MNEVDVEVIAEQQPKFQIASETGKKVVVVAWLVTAVYYFYQYTMRSAPAVMMPQLSEAFGVSTLGVASIVGLFYYAYSPFSLVAGAAMDKVGPRRLLPYAAATVGIGALLFATGDTTAASIGRFLQGAGGVFALVGAIYIATKNFPASQAATLIGATQMFGMAGGSAGQFAVGPLISSGISWNSFWGFMGIAGLVIGALLFFLIPRQPKKQEKVSGSTSVVEGFKIVFKNPQSLICGAVAGLLFMPTTIFDMVWGVRFLEQGHDIDYGTAVLRSATVPLGWIISCPLLGFISDRLGRRKPVIIGGAVVLLACMTWILYGIPNVLPPYVLGLTAGIASGAAMLPYTVIKETNPPQLGGTATGVINFLNFTFSALLGPVFGVLLMRVSGGSKEMELAHFQTAFTPLLYGVALAVVLAFFLKETGTAIQETQVRTEEATI